MEAAITIRPDIVDHLGEPVCCVAGCRATPRHTRWIDGGETLRLACIDHGDDDAVVEARDVRDALLGLAALIGDCAGPEAPLTDDDRVALAALLERLRQHLSVITCAAAPLDLDRPVPYAMTAAGRAGAARGAIRGAV